MTSATSTDPASPARVDGADEVDQGADEEPVAASRPAPTSPSWMARAVEPSSAVPIYAGMALVVVGFVLIALTWGRMAGSSAVALQLPYLASGGFTGLGLVVVRVGVIGLGAKRRDAGERLRQLERLARLLEGRPGAGDGDP